MSFLAGFCLAALSTIVGLVWLMVTEGVSFFGYKITKIQDD